MVSSWCAFSMYILKIPVLLDQNQGISRLFLASPATQGCLEFFWLLILAACMHPKPLWPIPHPQGHTLLSLLATLWDLRFQRIHMRWHLRATKITQHNPFIQKSCFNPMCKDLPHKVFRRSGCRWIFTGHHLKFYLFYLKVIVNRDKGREIKRLRERDKLMGHFPNGHNGQN